MKISDLLTLFKILHNSNLFKSLRSRKMQQFGTATLTLNCSINKYDSRIKIQNLKKLIILII